MSIEENDEKLIYEKEIAELVRLVFEKARKDSMGTSKNAWGNYIENNSNLKAKTFIRMYDRYILGDENQSIPILFSLNSGAEFLGYKDFADFCREVFPEQDLIPEKEKGIKKEKLLVERFQNYPKNNFRKKIVGTGIAAAISVGSYFGISAYNKPQCMYWNGNDYEEIGCAEIINPNVQIIPIDERLLEYLHKIEVSDTTTFFEAGKPIVWYLKVNGVIEFYSADGKHPINGKELRAVTPYIIDKYVLNK